MLERSAIVIDGGTSNKGFLLELLRTEQAQWAEFDRKLAEEEQWRMATKSLGRDHPE